MGLVLSPSGIKHLEVGNWPADQRMTARPPAERAVAISMFVHMCVAHFYVKLPSMMCAQVLMLVTDALAVRSVPVSLLHLRALVIEPQVIDLAIHERHIHSENGAIISSKAMRILLLFTPLHPGWSSSSATIMQVETGRGGTGVASIGIDLADLLMGALELYKYGPASAQREVRISTQRGGSGELRQACKSLARRKMLSAAYVTPLAVELMRW